MAQRTPGVVDCRWPQHSTAQQGARHSVTGTRAKRHSRCCTLQDVPHLAVGSLHRPKRKALHAARAGGGGRRAARQRGVQAVGEAEGGSALALQGRRGGQEGRDVETFVTGRDSAVLLAGERQGTACPTSPAQAGQRQPCLSTSTNPYCLACAGSRAGQQVPPWRPVTCGGPPHTPTPHPPTPHPPTHPSLTLAARNMR